MSTQDLPDFSRRRSLIWLTASLLYCAMPRRSWGFDAQQQLQLFVVFMSLSRILTGADKLDEDFGEHLYNVILAEPWGREHLTQVAEKLQITPASLTISPVELNKMLIPERFSDGERWFINHLLTTWVTGIYYHQLGNQVLTYRHALMYSALDDVSSPHGQCGGEFGYWTEAPTGISG